MGPENASFPLNASPQRGLFDWLLDLLATVVMHEVCGGTQSSTADGHTSPPAAVESAWGAVTPVRSADIWITTHTHMQATTRMTAKCLAIVWAPNLVPSPADPAAFIAVAAAQGQGQGPVEARLTTLKVR